MKKIILLLLVLLLLVGCKKDIKEEKKEKTKFQCFKTISDNLSNISYKIIGEYKKNNLINVKSVSTINFEKDGLDNYESFKSYIELINNEYKEKSGVNSSLTNNDNKLVLTVLYDISNMDKEEIINNNFDKDYLTLIDIYQKDGYTCE